MKFDHINCRPVYINQRKAPMVPFSNKHEFQTLQSEFVSNYSRLISEVFHRAFDVPQGTSALTWTDRDMILYGMAEFPDLRVRGVDLIMTVTKGHGLAWCISVSSWLADMVTAGCRGHARALRDWPVNTPSSDDIYSRTLVQEMVSSMYDNIEVFDQIYHSSFVDLMHPNTGMISTYTIKNWMQNILAFYRNQTMSEALETVIENALEEENNEAGATATKERKPPRRGLGKPRAEARPYKKYDLENLQGKIVKMKKQVHLQRSRLLLLEDKLEKHEKEVALRGGEAAA